MPAPSPTVRALTGPLTTSDVRAVLTLVSFSRPLQVVEYGSSTPHLTANLSEWTDRDAVIYRVLEDEIHADHQIIGFYNRSEKIKQPGYSFFESHHAKQNTFDLVIIHSSTDADWLSRQSAIAYQLLAPGGWLVWLGFTLEEPSRIREALNIARFSEKTFQFEKSNVGCLQKLPNQSTQPFRLNILWQGDVDVQHSLAAVNRALIDQLQMRGHTVSVRQTHSVPSNPILEDYPARFAIDRPLGKTPDVIIRHSWPPNLAKNHQGIPVVLIQPWEYGSPPIAWVEALNRGDIAEWWVPSEHTRQGILTAGVDANRVVVVRNGVDPSIHRVNGPKYPLKTRKKFKFLFVGGTIWRKGFDLVLEAYRRTFNSEHDVCLVIKDAGVGSFYAGQTSDHLIQEFQQTPGSPEIEYLRDDLSDLEMAQLYRAADCLVHPYRAESFALPVAEAMANGIPAIVTQNGPTEEWCFRRNSYQLPSRLVTMNGTKVGDLDTIGNPSYREPDLQSLCNAFEHVVQDTQYRKRGHDASTLVRRELTWEQAILTLEKRLIRLVRARNIPSARISLNMIVRNESANIFDCLNGIRHLFDEVVIVDTGSTDNTVEQADRLATKIIRKSWTDSFAEARNWAIDHSTGDWIFWLDADDRIDAINQRKLENLLFKLPNLDAAYVMSCRCLVESGGVEHSTDHVRLFRRNEQIRWRYRVHEQITPAIQSLGHQILRSDVVITHTGYTDPELVKRKIERDARLLQLDFQDHPNDPLIMFQLGVINHRQQRQHEAIEWLGASLSGLQTTDNIKPKAIALMAQCHREIHELDKAIQLISEGLVSYPTNGELIYLEAIIYQELGNFIGAEKSFLTLIASEENRSIQSGADGIRGYLGRFALAKLLAEIGRRSEAIQWLQLVILERPEFISAKLLLRDLTTRPG